MPIVFATLSLLHRVLGENLSPVIADIRLARPGALSYGVRVEEPVKRELEATLAARSELGPGHDDALAAGFLDRIERELDRRVEERVAAQTPAKRDGSALHPGNLALCIPIVAIAGGIGHLPGLIVAFIALAAVFLVAELRR
jgi:hypothetical protein